MRHLLLRNPKLLICPPLEETKLICDCTPGPGSVTSLSLELNLPDQSRSRALRELQSDPAEHKAALRLQSSPGTRERLAHQGAAAVMAFPSWAPHAAGQISPTPPELSRSHFLKRGGDSGAV